MERYRQIEVLGVKNVMTQEIYVNRGKKRSGRPLCRALSEIAQRLNREYRRMYRMFVDSFRVSSHELRTAVRVTSRTIIVQFPLGGIPLAGGSG